MLEVRDLSVSYGQHRALEGASIRVAPGEIVVILGANGAGKSTLLKAVSGICEGQVAGQIVLDGQDLAGKSPERIVEAGIALVPEGRGIFGDLTVEENLTLGAYSGRAREEERANLERVYSLFPKLVERRRQVARTMSGGEQQMVAIGRAMMSNPQILTLDEPSLGLSPLLCKELFENLGFVRDLGLGVLLVEQNARQSLAIADRGYLLENAHIVHEDSAAALQSDPAVQAAYLGAGASATGTHHDDAAPEAAEKAARDTAAASAIADAALQAVRPRTRPRPPRADDLIGTSMNDLVKRATDRQSAAVAASRTARPDATAADHGDRMQAMLRGIEQAARKARAARVVERPLPDTRPPGATARRTASPAAPASPAPAADPGPPPVIEIYRAPRVEVYRRRPGSTEFDRS